MLEQYPAILQDFAQFDLDGLVTVDITSAARWFYTDSEQEHWNVCDDFPVAVSPWRCAWLEFKMPSVINSEGNLIYRPGGEERRGALFVTIEIPEDKRPYPEQFDGARKLTGYSNAGTEAERRLQIMREKIAAGYTFRWQTLVKMYFSSSMGCAAGPVMLYYLDQSGQVMADFAGVFATGNIAPGNISGLLFPYLFALSLAHCKNVRVEPVSPTPPKVLAKRTKRGLPEVKYRTLVIDPFRVIVQGESGAGGSETKRAMHIVRGHFADYREAGLFGKYHGIYWREMYVRGSKDSGEVKKDYKIEKE